MGGRGSGGHNSKGKFRDVQCARLDVHELARDGKLTLGKRGTLFGTIGLEVAGGPDAQRLVLEFPIRSASGARLDPVQQVISCYWQRAHYGGRYLMFRCECGRSARVLYARYFSDRIWFFNCRSCVGITYQSTMGHRWDRSARRVEKLRARLKWRTGGIEPIRPRGMHERTYQRILGMIAYHEVIRKQGASYARNTDQISTALICGGSESFPNMVVIGWTVVAVPKGTPAHVITRLSADLRKVVADPQLTVRAQIDPFKPLFGDDLIHFIRDDQDRLAPLVQSLDKS